MWRNNGDGTFTQYDNRVINMFGETMATVH